MPELTLHYLDLAGRAHSIREALVTAGVEFHDRRIDFEEWGRTNGDQTLYPQGTVPVLEVDGKRIGDTTAILTYVGAIAGFLPTDPLLLARVYEIGGYVEEMYTGSHATAPFLRTLREEDPEAKKQLRSGPFVDTVRYYLGCVQRVVSESSTKEGFALGDSRTIADFVIGNVISHMTCKDIDFFDDSFIAQEFAPLVKIRESVDAHPAVAAWLAKGNGY